MSEEGRKVKVKHARCVFYYLGTIRVEVRLSVRVQVRVGE